MLAFQAKCIPQASHSPWVRSHATEKTTPVSIVDQDAGPAGARIEDVGETEEQRHDEGRRRYWADGLDEAAIRIAAKDDLFSKRGDGKRRQG